MVFDSVRHCYWFCHKKCEGWLVGRLNHWLACQRPGAGKRMIIVN